MLQIKEITDKKIWDSFVEAQPNTSFLQSWSWGEFEKKLGHTLYHLGIFENDELIGASLIALVNSRRGTYLESIGGPLIKLKIKSENVKVEKEVFEFWLQSVSKIAREHKVSFLRLRPPLEHSVDGIEFLKQFGFRETKLYYQAELTRRINLTSSLEDILSNMKKKTRYEIRRTEREGVVVEKYSSESRKPSFAKASEDKQPAYAVRKTEVDAAFTVFLDLYSDMVKRQGYVGYSKDYLRKQFDVFFNNNQASLYLAKHNDVFVAGTIFFHYGNTTTYHHAASLPQQHTSPQSLILWEAIKDAKARNAEWFDLFGIAPPGKRYESRMGLTFFKEGFGGEVFQWLRTHDLVYRKLPYFFSQIIELLPGRIRKLV